MPSSRTLYIDRLTNTLGGHWFYRMSRVHHRLSRSLPYSWWPRSQPFVSSPETPFHPRDHEEVLIGTPHRHHQQRIILKFVYQNHSGEELFAKVTRKATCVLAALLLLLGISTAPADRKSVV